MGEVEVYQAEAVDQEIFNDPEAVAENSNNLVAMDGQAVIDPEVEVTVEDTAENRLVLSQVRERIDDIEETYWNLCTDLYRVRESHLFELEGFKSFEEYASARCDLKKRMAHYYCRIHSFFKVDVEKILADKPEIYQQVLELAPKLGLTRCIKIAHSKNFTSENLLPFMQSVAHSDGTKKLTVKQVEEKISELAGILPEGEDEADDKSDIENPTVDSSRQFRVPLEESQASTVEKALDVAAKMSNNKKKSINLAHICSEYIANNSATGNRKKDIVKALSRQEEFLGLTLVAMDVAKNKVVYGPKQVDTLLHWLEGCLGVSLVALNTEKEEIVYGQETLDGFSSGDDES